MDDIITKYSINPLFRYIVTQLHSKTDDLYEIKYNFNGYEGSPTKGESKEEDEEKESLRVTQIGSQIRFASFISMITSVNLFRGAHIIDQIFGDKGRHMSVAYMDTDSNIVDMSNKIT